MGWSLIYNKVAKTPKYVWHADSFADITGLSVESLAKYGWPFYMGNSHAIKHASIRLPNGDTYPLNRGHMAGRIEERYIPPSTNMIVQMKNWEVMKNGYGKNITPENFAIVQHFLNKKITLGNGKPLPVGAYTFARLLKMGVLVNGRKINARQRFLAASVYPWAKFKLHSAKRIEDSYVHGSVGFALMKKTRFKVSSQVMEVNAEIGVMDDNWDLNTRNRAAHIANAIDAAFHGAPVNPVIFQFYGPGKRMVVRK